MSQPSRRNNKRTRSNVRSSIVPSEAPLLQLPADAIGIVQAYLPWYDRMLHVSHVHPHLPLAALVWTESDNVRLSDAMLVACEGGV